MLDGMKIRGSSNSKDSKGRVYVSWFELIADSGIVKLVSFDNTEYLKLWILVCTVNTGYIVV